MVTISSYEKREGSDGNEFLVLILQGSVEFVFSKKTGLPYATASRCSMPTTFDEATCQQLIGKQMHGSIQKVKVDEPYEYTIARTGETVELDYNFVYSPIESGTVENAVFETN